MRNYTTQMDAARRGIITPEMKAVAAKEYRTEEEIRDLVAKGFTLTESVQKAKMYIADALMAQLDLGKGSGPLLHNFDLNTSYAEEKHI